MNSFLLSMMSPVLRKALCGSFREGPQRVVVLDDVLQSTFTKLSRMACGETGLKCTSAKEMIELATLAERLQMVALADVLQNALVNDLKIDTCAEVLQSCTGSGLWRLESACYGMVQESFEQVSRTTGFSQLGEEVVGQLLEEDVLGVSVESVVLDAAIRWVRQNTNRRGAKLFRTIRYGAIDDHCLAEIEQSSDLLESEGLADLVKEARARKGGMVGHSRWDGVERLCAQWSVTRTKPEIRWRQYAYGGAQRLSECKFSVTSLVRNGSNVFSGSRDGCIQLWDSKTGRHNRSAQIRERSDSTLQCLCLAAWGDDRLVSGHSDGMGRVWDTEKWQWIKTVPMHNLPVSAMCVHDGALFSCSLSDTKIWDIGTASATESEWICKNTLAFDESMSCFTVWGIYLIRGTADDSISVWDIQTGTRVIMLSGPCSNVKALALSTEHLYSASEDGKVCQWKLGSWEHVSYFQVDLQGHTPCDTCLAVCGTKLISSHSKIMTVFDLAPTLRHEQTLEHRAWLQCLLTVGADVWAGTCVDIVVWRRQRSGPSRPRTGTMPATRTGSSCARVAGLLFCAVVLSLTLGLYMTFRYFML